MGRLNDWLSENYIAEPIKPDGDIRGILDIPYKDMNSFPAEDIERCVFVLNAWLYYISYQLGVLEGRTRANKTLVEDEITFAAQKYDAYNFKEKCALAKVNDKGLKQKSDKLLLEEAKVTSLKELKYAIRDKIDTVKMIYFRKRGNRDG
jgi:hypothetical protein